MTTDNITVGNRGLSADWGVLPGLDWVMETQRGPSSGWMVPTWPQGKADNSLRVTSPKHWAQFSFPCRSQLETGSTTQRMCSRMGWQLDCWTVWQTAPLDLWEGCRHWTSRCWAEQRGSVYFVHELRMVPPFNSFCSRYSINGKVLDVFTSDQGLCLLVMQGFLTRILILL